jgi:hypothetical protein
LAPIYKPWIIALDGKTVGFATFKPESSLEPILKESSKIPFLINQSILTMNE